VEFGVVLSLSGGAVEGFSGGQHGRLRFAGGDTVLPDKWDSNPMEECSHGLHVFITRAEAEAYSL
jgi:hypothetical protein